MTGKGDKLIVQQSFENPSCFDIASGHLCLFTKVSPDKGTSNEDALLIQEIDKNLAVFAVADGVGGHPGGAQASELALKELSRALKDAEGDRVRGAIMDGFEQANKTILSQSSGSATTLIAIELEKNRVRPYHVGDTMALVVGQRGKLKLQTLSHSPVGYALESGLLDASEAMHHEERHIVSNLVGDPEMRIEVGAPMRLAPKDTLLIASDGLFDNLHVDEVAEIARKGPIEEVCNKLVEKCTKRMTQSSDEKPSKPDDLSIIDIQEEELRVFAGSGLSTNKVAKDQEQNKRFWPNSSTTVYY